MLRTFAVRSQVVMTMLVLMAVACAPGATSVSAEPPLATVPPTSIPSVEPSAGPSAAPTPATVPSPTAPLPSPEAPTPEIAAEASIALYKIIVAGDYSALRVSASGQAEYTRHSRGYEVLDHRAGTLGPEEVGALLALLRDQGFYELEDVYEPASPGEGTPEIRYEDVYYWIRAEDGQRQKTVLAHEYASPSPLQEVIRALMEAGAALPESDGEGAFLLAVGYETLPHLRREEGMASLTLDAEHREAYPALELAARRPCSLVSVAEQPGLDPEQLFPSGTHMMEVMLDNDRYVILLLRR